MPYSPNANATNSVSLHNMNGKQGDDPILDIMHWKIRRFSEGADKLIAEIVELGGRAELERTFDLFQPPPIEQFEIALRQIRDRLWKDRRDRGWEV
jgi:hypothetical protein